MTIVFSLFSQFFSPQEFGTHQVLSRNRLGGSCRGLGANCRVIVSGANDFGFLHRLIHSGSSMTLEPGTC